MTNHIHPANLYYTVVAMNNELQGIKNYQTALSKKISQLKSEHEEMEGGKVVGHFHFGGFNSSHTFYPSLSDATLTTLSDTEVDTDGGKDITFTDFTVLAYGGNLYLNDTTTLNVPKGKKERSYILTNANHLTMQSISFDVLPCEQTEAITDFMEKHEEKEGKLTQFVGDITSAEYAIGCDSTGSAIFYIPYDSEHEGKHSKFKASHSKEGKVCDLLTSEAITNQFTGESSEIDVDLSKKFIILKTIKINNVNVRFLIACDNTKDFGITTDGKNGILASELERDVNFNDSTNNWRSIDYTLRVNGEKYRISNSSFIECWVKYNGNHEKAHGLLMYPEFAGARYCRVVLVDTENE